MLLLATLLSSSVSFFLRRARQRAHTLSLVISSYDVIGDGIEKRRRYGERKGLRSSPRRARVAPPPTGAKKENNIYLLIYFSSIIIFKSSFFFFFCHTHITRYKSLRERERAERERAGGEEKSDVLLPSSASFSSHPSRACEARNQRRR